MQLSRKIWPNNRLGPSLKGWRPLWEILDPPLLHTHGSDLEPGFQSQWVSLDYLECLLSSLLLVTPKHLISPNNKHIVLRWSHRKDCPPPNPSSLEIKFSHRQLRIKMKTSSGDLRLLWGYVEHQPWDASLSVSHVLSVVLKIPVITSWWKHFIQVRG